MTLPDGLELWRCVAIGVLVMGLVYILTGGRKQWL